MWETKNCTGWKDQTDLPCPPSKGKMTKPLTSTMDALPESLQFHPHLLTRFPITYSRIPSCFCVSHVCSRKSVQRPASFDKNTTTLTLVDHFSKAVQFIPLIKLPSASETSELLVRHVLHLHGFPKDIYLTKVSSFSLRYAWHPTYWNSYCPFARACS